MAPLRSFQRGPRTQQVLNVELADAEVRRGGGADARAHAGGGGAAMGGGRVDAEVGQRRQEQGETGGRVQ